MKLRSSKDVIKYATAYAKKSTQKMTPEDFRSTGRFWGCSYKMCESILEFRESSSDTGTLGFLL